MVVSIGGLIAIVVLLVAIIALLVSVPPWVPLVLVAGLAVAVLLSAYPVRWGGP